MEDPDVEENVAVPSREEDSVWVAVIVFLLPLITSSYSLHLYLISKRFSMVDTVRAKPSGCLV